MSQENVEIVRRTNEARNRRDVDAVVREVDPDLEFDWSESRAAAGGTIPEILRGREQLGKQLSELLDLWEKVTWDLREIIEVGPDQVLEVTHVRFSGREGIEFDDDGALLWTFQGGKAVRLKFFPSKEKALEAVSMRE
jgi:ketosteroid isomerase-like protein